MKKRILIIAPHPDDELVGCGGTYLKSARARNEVHVIYLTRGAAKGEDEKAALRKDAVITIAKSLGIKKSNLTFYNQEELVGLIKSTNAKTVEKHLITDIKKINPDEIYVTAYEGGNIDHDVANLLVSRCRDYLSSTKKFSDIEYYEFCVYNNYLNWSLFSYKKVIQIVLREIVKRVTKRFFYWDKSRLPRIEGCESFKLDMDDRELRRKTRLFDRYRRLAEAPLTGKQPRKLLSHYSGRDILRKLPYHDYTKEPHKRFLLPLGYELAWGISFLEFSKLAEALKKR